MTDHETSSLSMRTARAGLWTISGKLISKIVDFTTLVVLARFLTPSDFGLVAMAVSPVFIVDVVMELPLGSALIRVEAPTKSMFDTALTLGMIRSALIAVVLGGLAWPISYFYNDARLLPLICLLAFAPITRGLISPRMVAFNKSMDFRRDFLLDVVSKILSCVVASTIAVLSKSYWALPIGTVSTAALMMVSSYFFAPMKPTLTVKNWDHFADLVGWNSLTQLLGAMNWQLDRLLVPKFSSVAEFGKYAAGGDLSTIPLQAVLQPASRPLMVALSSGKNELADLQKKYASASRLLVTLLTPILLFISAVSGPIIFVVLGKAWQQAAPILFWLSIAEAISIMTVPLAPLAIVTRRTKLNTIRIGCELSLKIPMMIVAGYFFGVPGLLFSRVAVAFAGNVIAIFMVKRILKLAPVAQFKNILHPLAVAILLYFPLMAITSLYYQKLDFIYTFAAIALSAVMYFALYALALILTSRAMFGDQHIEVKMWILVRCLIYSNLQKFGKPKLS